MELTDITLTSVSRGAAPQLFAHEFRRVLANMQDPNTDPLEERTITLKIRFKPAESREEARTRVEVATKLASLAPVSGHMFVGRSVDGDSKSPLRAVTQDIKQEVLPLDEPTPAPASTPELQSGIPTIPRASND